MTPRLRRILFAIFLLGLAPIAGARAPAPKKATISGYVRDAVSGTPIANAEIEVGTSSITTGADGLIPETGLPLASLVETVDVVVRAEGYTPWRFEGVSLQVDRPVAFHVKLRRIETSPLGEEETPDRAPPAASPGSSETARANPSGDAPDAEGLAVDAAGPMEGSEAESLASWSPPEYIDIGRTYSGKCVYPPPENLPVQRMRFEEYVRNVLPNEWIASWPDASLDVGAVAVKQYAWYTAFVEQKWRSQGYNFDLLDSPCDQHYRDDSAHPATDAALMRTWPVILTRDGELFPTYYRSHDELCPEIPGCMGQWGSYSRAWSGKNAAEILLHYYSPADIGAPGLTAQVYLPSVSP